MARNSVTSQPVVRAGLSPNLTAPNVDGDIVDAGNVALWVENGSGAPITVTIQATYTQDGIALPNPTVSVPAAGRRLIGPFPARTFAQPADAAVGAGRVLVDYSAITSVTRAAVTVA